LIDLTVFLTAYSIFDLPLVPANLLAWLVAVSGSYVMNCFVTFAPESGRKLRWRSYGAFVLSGIAGVIATTATLVMASYWVSVIAAKLLAMGASFAVTNCTETGLVESSSCGTGNSILRASRGDDVEAQHVARRNANPLDYFKALSIGTSLCVFCSDW